MKKEKSNQAAIIIGAIIIALSIIYVYNQTPGAILSKQCKKMVRELGMEGQGIVESQIYSKCLNGKM